MTSKQDAVQEAAAAVIAHGGPAALTSPHDTLAAMGRAYDTGATGDDITAEMRRQRGEN